MIIGINGFEAVVPRFGYDPKTGLPRRVGSSEYCYQLLVNLHKIDVKNSYVIYLPQSPTPDLPKESSKWHYKIVEPRRMWTLFGMSIEFLLRRSKIDVFFSPTHYLPIVAPRKSVISILDLSYIHFPELFKTSDLRQLTKWTRYSAKKAARIFTISQASKGDIIKEYGIPGYKIGVTYPGIKKALGDKYKTLNMDELSKKYGIGRKYVLFVGTLQPRKNLTRLIEAFSRVNKDIDLIIIGKKGWLFEDILAAPKKSGIENRVNFLDTVTDEDLPSFYKNAICLVLPSLYEGFGLPVLEAMKYGCPVIASNISSLPEAGGDAALYVDPKNSEDIKNKIELIIKDEKLRKELIKKGYEQVKKFSWEKTAKETLKVLENI